MAAFQGFRSMGIIAVSAKSQSKLADWALCFVPDGPASNLYDSQVLSTT